MAWRHTLPDECGVEWTNPDNSDRVLFSYRGFDCRREGLTAVVDVTTGEDVPVTAGAFTTQPTHTYRLRF